MATRLTGTPSERLAVDAYVKLMRASAGVNAQVLPVLMAESGITVGQLGVLEALHHLGPMPQCVLAGKLLVSASNLTTVLDNLERDGLVRRERDPADRRVSIATLTAAGADRLASFFPGHIRRLEAAMSLLDHDELVQLASLCRKLGLAVATTPVRTSA
jgi:MarR family transcriptional regulator, 2-MHQ and catechol-resistance regulon repressor